jgi:BirA family transcriptional regulator, biotin operon repressor / biotin---[acetyl-CoA-carboxylase] ligase
LQNNTFSTLFVGQNLIKLLSVDSTNNYLKKLTSNSEPLPNGTVIMAENQYAGRGQQGNIWHAESGKNLTFSVYLTTDFITIGKQFMLNMAISIALNNALVKYLPAGLSIKWPNDVYFANKKIGGVLIENTIVGNRLKHTIIGIGLNVNQTVFAKELENKAGSIAQILQQDVDLTKLLNEICTQIEQLYLKLKNNETSLSTLYTAKLYKINQLAKYRSLVDGRIFEGQIEGITAMGLLKIKPLNGDSIEFNFKEIEFLA